MLHSKINRLAPIAAALALALASSGALAAIHVNPNQQYTPDQQTTSSAQSMNEAQSTDAFREGQLWATYVINPALQAYHIKADIQGSEVTLQGTVDTRAEKQLAETIAKHVNGISSVNNRITVDPAHVVVATFIPSDAFAQHVQNSTISAEINSRLAWNEYTEAGDIKVKTNKGEVTLTGVARTRKAKRRAERIAANTKGVHSVNNQITIRDGNEFAGSGSHVTDDWITNKIRTSYRYTTGMNPGDIKVDVDGGRVTLTGEVDNNHQKQLAIEIAQHTHGVHQVRANGLRMDPAMVVTKARIN